MQDQKSTTKTKHMTVEVASDSKQFQRTGRVRTLTLGQVVVRTRRGWELLQT